MANVLAIDSFIVVVVVSLTGLTVWTAVMLPHVVERAQRRLEKGPVLCLICGALFSVAGVGLLVAMIPFRSAGFRLSSDILEHLTATIGWPRFANDHQIATHAIGWLLVSPVMASWIIGGAGLARIFEARTVSETGFRGPTHELTRGAFFMSCSYFLPFVGWFVFLPLVGAMSVGAGLLALVARRSAEVVVERTKVPETNVPELVSR
jgi:hypothetical protein